MEGDLGEPDGRLVSDKSGVKGDMFAEVPVTVVETLGDVRFSPGILSEVKTGCSAPDSYIPWLGVRQNFSHKRSATSLCAPAAGFDYLARAGRDADPPDVYERIVNYFTGEGRKPPAVGESVPSAAMRPPFSVGISSSASGCASCSAGKKLMNPSSFSGEAGRWACYGVYWEKLFKWNGWTDVTDAMMLNLSVDAEVYIHGLCDFKHFSRAELLYRLEERFGAAHTLADDNSQLHHQQKLKDEHLAEDI